MEKEPGERTKSFSTRNVRLEKGRWVGSACATLLVGHGHIAHLLVRPIPSEHEIESDADERKSGSIHGGDHVAGGQEGQIRALRPEGLIEATECDDLSIQYRIRSFEIEGEGDDFEIDDGVRIDEADLEVLCVNPA